MSQTAKAVAPVGGHLLDRAIEIDVAAPGFLAWLICLAGAKRHAVFAILTHLQKESPSGLVSRLPIETSEGDRATPLLKLAHRLRVASSSDIIKAVFGTCPSGFVGLLNRLGPEPLRPGPASYENWHQVFERRGPPAAVIMEVQGPLSPQTLCLVLSIDEAALSPALLDRVSHATARNLNIALELVRRCCTSIDPDVIRSSLGNGHGKLNVGRWLGMVLRRHMDTLPYPPPVAKGDPSFEPLLTGPEFVVAARAFKNCLASHRIFHVAAGTVAYAMSRQHEAVVEFRRLTNGWLASGIHGPKNAPVEHRAMCDIIVSLMAKGLPFVQGLRDREEPLAEFPELGGPDIMVIEPPPPAVQELVSR